MSWEKVKLIDCCVSIADGDHQPPPKSDSGIPFVTIANIVNNQFDFKNSMFVPESYYEKLDYKRKAKKNDILYSVVGSFGIPVFIKDDKPFVFQRHIAILRPNKKVNARFLYYKMLSRNFYMKADAAAIGAAQRTVSLTSLRNIEIIVPPMETQRRIADVLSAYDDLIENNRKQIKLLEEAAQRLYKEWFVNLRFPGHEHTKIVDGVPEGWDRMPVGSLIGKVDRTKQIPTSEYLPNGKIPVIDQSREFIAGYTNDVQAIVKSKAPIIVFGDHTRILKLVQFPFAKGADGTQLIISASERMPQRLLYCSLMNIDLSNYHYARHFKYLKSEIILLPSKGIADDFEKITDPVFKKIQSCRDQCCWGQEARDRLLPKLMSGEVEV